MMEDVFVTIDLSEPEYDAILEFVSEQEIQTGLSSLYERLLKAVDEEDQDDDDDDTEDE